MNDSYTRMSTKEIRKFANQEATSFLWEFYNWSIHCSKFYNWFLDAVLSRVWYVKSFDGRNMAMNSNS